MKRLSRFFEAAAKIAKDATCQRAKCGTVIVKDGQILGRGANGPTPGDKNRCNWQPDLSRKPKYDKTCCVHAEWRAILDACKRHGDKIDGATLYFMRVDDEGNFTDAGQPYCTVCSRLTLEAGIAVFALWNDAGADLYDTREYNQKSYHFFEVTR